MDATMLSEMNWSLPARLFRRLFGRTRSHGYMRVGTWMATVFPSMQNIRVPLHDTSVALDLRFIDHQTIFLDGRVRTEAEELEMVAGLFPENGVVVDVGANLGIYSVLMAQEVGACGKVIAYEPDPRALVKNAANWPQLIVRPFAVSDREEKAYFQMDRSTALSRLVPANGSTGRGLPVRTVTLDDDLGRLGVGTADFLKIDVEGAEARVLAGASRLLSSPKPPVLMFEWIPAFRARSERTAFSVLRDVIGLTWKLFRVGWDLPPREILLENEPLDLENANILAFPPSRQQELEQFLRRVNQTATE